MPDFTTAAASWLLAFFIGVYVGRYSETHKETVMSLRVKARSHYDTWAPALFLVIALTALAGILTASAAVRQNGRDLVTNCENTNESRQAARALWGYVIDLSAVNNPDRTPREVRIIGGFRDYVNDVYQPRDCTDLSKKYPLPDPPEIVAPERPNR